MRKRGTLQQRADEIGARFGLKFEVAEREQEYAMSRVYMVSLGGVRLMRHWRNELHTLGHLETIERTLEVMKESA